MIPARDAVWFTCRVSVAFISRKNIPGGREMRYARSAVLFRSILVPEVQGVYGKIVWQAAEMN
jgi:hypothetical protein